MSTRVIIYGITVAARRVMVNVADIITAMDLHRYKTLILDMDGTILEGHFPENTTIRPVMLELVKAAHAEGFDLWVVTFTTSEERTIREKLAPVMQYVPRGQICQVNPSKNGQLQAIASNANAKGTGTVFIDDHLPNITAWQGHPLFGMSYPKIAFHLTPGVSPDTFLCTLLATVEKSDLYVSPAVPDSFASPPRNVRVPHLLPPSRPGKLCLRPCTLRY